MTRDEFSSVVPLHLFERLCLHESCFNTEVVCSNLLGDIFRQEANVR